MNQCLVRSSAQSADFYQSLFYCAAPLSPENVSLHQFKVCDSFFVESGRLLHPRSITLLRGCAVTVTVTAQPLL